MAKKEFGRFDYGTARASTPFTTTVQAIQKARASIPRRSPPPGRAWTTIETLWGPGKMGGLKTYGIKHSVYANKVPILRVEKNEISWGDWGEDTCRRQQVMGVGVRCRAARNPLTPNTESHLLDPQHPVLGGKGVDTVGTFVACMVNGFVLSSIYILVALASPSS